MRVDVVVARGHDLMVADRNTSDPYVKVTAVDAQGKPLGDTQTEVVKSSTSPVWNHEHTLDVDGDVRGLVFDVMDWDRFTANDLMGRASVEAKTLVERNHTQTTLHLEPGGDADAKKWFDEHGTLGTIEVTWSIPELTKAEVRAEEEAAAAEAAVRGAPPSPQPPTAAPAAPATTSEEHAAAAAAPQDDAEDAPPPVEPEVIPPAPAATSSGAPAPPAAVPPQPAVAVLDAATVSIIGADDLVAGDSSTSDPYVKLTVLSNTQEVLAQRKTPAVKKTLAPTWQYDTTIPVPHGQKIASLVFEVWDDDMLRDDFLGTCAVCDEDMFVEHNSKTQVGLKLEPGDRGGNDLLKEFKARGVERGLGKLWVSWNIPGLRERQHAPDAHTTDQPGAMDTEVRTITIAPSQATGLPDACVQSGVLRVSFKQGMRARATELVGSGTQRGDVLWSEDAVFRLQGSGGDDGEGGVAITFEMLVGERVQASGMAMLSDTEIDGIDETDGRVVEVPLRVVQREMPAVEDEEEEEEEEEERAEAGTVDDADAPPRCTSDDFDIDSDDADGAGDAPQRPAPPTTRSKPRKVGRTRSEKPAAPREATLTATVYVHTVTSQRSRSRFALDGVGDDDQGEGDGDSLPPAPPAPKEPPLPQTIEISVLHAKNLAPMDFAMVGKGTSDPYVEFAVDGSIRGGHLYKTASISKDLNPSWDEEFEVDLVVDDPDRSSWVAHLNVWDWDRVGDSDWMGYTALHITKAHLREATEAMVEWTLDLTGRPDDEHAVEDAVLIKKNNGSLGTITIGVRAQQPPLPPMARVQMAGAEERQGYVKEYLGTKEVHGDRVQVYMVAMDDGTDERHLRDDLDVLGDIDDEEDAVRNFENHLRAQTDAFEKLIKAQRTQFAEENTKYLDASLAGTLTPEELSVRGAYEEYLDACEHMDAKFVARLRRHGRTFLEKFEALIDTPAKRIHVIRSEKDVRNDLVSKWEAGRTQLKKDTALCTARVAAARLVVGGVKAVADDVELVYVVVTSGQAGHRATTICRPRNGATDFPCGRRKTTTFPDVDPGDAGVLLWLDVKKAAEGAGGLPTENMVEADPTLGRVSVQVPTSALVKSKDDTTITQDLKWVRVKGVDDVEMNTALRLKLVLDVTDHKQHSLDKDEAQEAAKVLAKLKELEEEEERKAREAEARRIPTTLEVEVKHGRNLIIMDYMSSDPYAVVEVLGGWPQAPSVYVEKTKAVKSTINPDWNKTFKFNINAILEAVLDRPEDEQSVKVRVTVWDDDIDADDFMGYAEWVFTKEELKADLKDWSMMPRELGVRPTLDPATIHADKKLVKEKKYLGEIALRFRASEPKHFGSKTEQNLLAMEAADTSSETGAAVHHLDYAFIVDNPDAVVLEKYGKNVIVAGFAPRGPDGRPASRGACAAYTAGVRRGMVVDTVNGMDTGSLKDVERFMKEGNDVRFGVRCDDAKTVTFKCVRAEEVAYTVDTTVEEWPRIIVAHVEEKSDAEENGLVKDMVVMGANAKPVLAVDALVEQTLARETTLLCLNPPDGSQVEGRLSSKDLKVNVFLRVVKARNLIKADMMLFKKSDPYVIASAVDARGTPLVGRRMKVGLPIKTSVESNTLNPTWNFAFPSNIVMDAGEKIVFEVWDDDLIGADEFLGQAELDPWEDAGREDNQGAERWMTLTHRGHAEDTVAAKHTSGEKPLGELLVFCKASLVAFEDLVREESTSLGGADLALDEDGHAYEMVQHRESLAVHVVAYRDCPTKHRDPDKVYAVVRLTAPPAAAGRVREHTTAPAEKTLEELTWKDEQAKLTFDDCGESAVEGFTVHLYHKSLFGADDFIGKVVVTSASAVWEAGDCGGEWFDVAPAKKKQGGAGGLGAVRLRWVFGLGEKQRVKKFEGQTFDSLLQAEVHKERETAMAERRLPVYDRMRGDGYVLDIEVYSCEGLAGRGAVVVTATCGGLTEHTDASPKTDCPEWDTAAFHFPLACRSDRVTFVVTSDGDELGKARLAAHSEFSLDGQHALAIYDDAGNAVGMVTVGYRYTHATKGALGFLPELRGDVYPPVPKKQRVKLTALLENESAVTLKVLQASNLAGVDSGTLRPKVLLEYAHEDITIATAEHNMRYPLFNADYKLPLRALGGATEDSTGPDGRVLVKIYDHNAVFADQLVGVVPLNLVHDYNDTLTATSPEQVAQLAIAAVPPYVVTLREPSAPAPTAGEEAAPLPAGEEGTQVSDVDAFRVCATELLGGDGRVLTHVNGRPVKSETEFLNLQKEGATFADAAELTFERVGWFDLQCRVDEQGKALEEDLRVQRRHGRLGRVQLQWAHNMQVEREVLPDIADDEGEPRIELTIVEGEAMIARDLRTSDPYVLVRYGEELRKTAYKNSTLNPRWDETLEPLPLTDAEMTLELLVQDFDTASSDDFMGSVRFKPLEWVYDDPDGTGSARRKDGWLNLVPREQNKEDDKLYAKNNSSFGRLRVQVAVKGDLSGVKNAQVDLSREAALAREEEEIPAGKIKKEGALISIYIDKAEGLSVKSARPTCKVVMNGRENVTQPPGAASGSPTWLAGPFSRRYPKHDPNGDTPVVYDVVMEVLDDDGGSLGYFAQDVGELLHEVGHKTVPLRNRHEEDTDAADKKPLGELTFRWEVKFTSADAAPWLDPDVRKDLKRYLEEHNLALQLTLKVARCTQLIDRSFIGKSDPYVTLACGMNHSQTKVISSNQNPVFNHEVVWQLTTFEQPVEFQIMDKELLGADHELGVCRLQLSTIADERGEETIAIQPSTAMLNDSNKALHSNLGYLTLEYAIQKVRRTAVAVQFSVVEAEGLADPNTLFAIKPRVEVAYGEGAGETKFTTALASGTSPVWSAVFNFALHVDEKTPVRIAVWDGDVCLGVWGRGMEFMGDDNTGDEWVALRPRGGNAEDAQLESKSGSLGQVHLRWETDTPEARQEREMKREARLAKLYDASNLAVKVLRARNLPARMMLSPQCRVKFPPTADDADAVASKKMSGTSPFFGVEASYKLSTQLLNQDVEITVVDAGTFSDAVLGKVLFNPWDNAADTKGERWVQLHDAAAADAAENTASPQRGRGQAAKKGAPEVYLSWALADEHAKTQPVLQVCVERVVDAVIPVGSGLATASDTGTIQVAVEFGPYHRTTHAVTGQKADAQLGTQAVTVAMGEFMEFDPLPPTSHFVFNVVDVRSLEDDINLGTVEWEWGVEADVEEGSKQLAIQPASDAQGDIMKRVASLGFLAIRWKLVNRAAGGLRESQKVQVTVVKARNLPPVDSPMRVYTVVSFGGQQAISDTTQDGQLGFQAVFPAKNEGEVVRVEVWEKNFGLAKNTFLGYATIPYGHDEEADGEEWLRLRPREGVEADYDLAAKYDGILGEVKVQWTWDAETFAATRKQLKAATRHDLTVTVRNATGLTPHDTNGLSDPYVVLRMGDQEHRTVTIENTLAPAWNETFTFEDVNPKLPLRLECFDHDPAIDADDFMGHAKWVVPKDFKITPNGVATVRLGIRSGNKDDVKLQEKHQGRLGAVSFEWEMEEVPEEDADAAVVEAPPIGVITVTILSAIVHSPKKVVKVRATVGEVARETMKQVGQAPTWDKLGMRDDWKYPQLAETTGVYIEMVDAKSGKTIAAREVVLSEFDERDERRQQFTLYRVVEGKVVDGSATGDMVDVYLTCVPIGDVDPDAAAAERAAGEAAAAAALTGVNYCGGCRKVVADPEAVVCPRCDGEVVDMSAASWRPAMPTDENHQPLGALCIGGVLPADQAAGSVGQAIARTSKAVFVFGGINKAGFNPRLRQYDIPLQRWTTLDDAHPYHRYGASMVHCSGGLLVYGGYGPGGLDAGLTSIGAAIETDSHVIDVEPDQEYWADPKVALGDMDHHPHQGANTTATTAAGGGAGESITAATLGLSTPGGAGKGAPSTGAQLPNGYFDSVLRYDLSTRTWSKLKSFGPGWDFRANHVAVMYKSRMLVYGGWGIFVRQTVYDSSRRSARLRKPHLRYSTLECRRGDLSAYNVATGKWSWIKPASPDGPPPRSHHTGVLKPGTSWLVVFGGATLDDTLQSAYGDYANAHPVDGAGGDTAHTRYLGDLQIFDIQTRVWTEVAPHGDAPAPRAEHAASIFEHYMFVFGGRNAQRTFGEDQCYAFCFGNGVWTRVARHHSLTRTLGGGVTRNYRHRTKRFANEREDDAKTGRWGMTIVAFRPPLAKGAGGGDGAEVQTLQQLQKARQRQRAEELLAMIGEGNAGQAGGGAGGTRRGKHAVADPRDVKLCLLILGGCEKDVIVPGKRGAWEEASPPPARKDVAGEDGNDAADEEIMRLTDELGHAQKRNTHRTGGGTSGGGHAAAYMLRDSVVHPPRGSDNRGHVLANPAAPVAVQRHKRLRLPELRGSCASATMWELVSTSYSKRLEGGVAAGGEGKRRPTIADVDKEKPWGATGYDTGKRYIQGAGGGPARLIAGSHDGKVPEPNMKKMKQEDIDTVALRLTSQRGVYPQGRVDRVAQLRRKIDAENAVPPGAKRKQEAIDTAIARLAEGRAASGRARRVPGVVLPNPGDAVRLAVPKVLNGVNILAYTAGVVQVASRKLRRDACMVQFPALAEPAVVPIDDLELLPAGKGQSPRHFGVQRPNPTARARKGPATTAPPRRYVFPEQWLVDEEDGDDDDF